MKVWKLLLLLGGLGAACLIVLIGLHIGIFPRLVHNRAVVEMPDLRNLTVDAARARLAGQDLEVVSVREQADATVPAGRIVEQNPPAGNPVRGGRTVKVVTSSGPAGGAAPDLTGLSLRQAEMTLQRDAFRLGRVARLARSDLTTSAIVYQSPPPGRRLQRGKPIDVVMGEPAPPPVLRMPNLRGAPLYRARQEIAAAGCVLAPITYEKTSKQPANTVVSQTPEPGRRIGRGERVALVASSR